MNAEVRRIRENILDVKDNKPQRLTDEELISLMTKLNSNISSLLSSKNYLNVEIVSDKIVENIYYVLETFGKMGIYPDYFFRVIFDKNTEWKTISKDNLSENNAKKEFNLMYAKILYGRIRDGLANHKYELNVAGDGDINDNFIEMVSFFQNFHMPFNESIEEFKLKFDGRFNSITNVMDTILNADDFIDDMEGLAELLFQYLSIMVEIGVNPKEKLDNLISYKSEKGKSK